MNWSVFAIFAYLFLALRVGAAPMMEIPTRFGQVGPQFVLLLAVVIGMFAPHRVCYLAWVMLGLLVDLTTEYARGGGPGSFALAGPHVLGYLAGAAVILQLRTMVFRQHPFSIGVAVVICGLAVELIVVLLFSLRGMYDPLAGFSAMPQLALRGISLLYTGLVGVILAMPLVRAVGLFGFPTSNTKRPVRWGR